MGKFDAAVIGTIFTDFKGFAKNEYNPIGRNPGKVEITQGGVARNVAENMSNLGLSVQLVSSVDEGMLGDGVLSHLEAVKVDTSCIVKAPSEGMGIWMLINNMFGEQVGSISQLPAPRYIENTIEESGDNILSNADNIVLEVDVSVETTEKVIAISKKYNKKVYALPATMEVAMKTRHLLSKLECFICNDIEAGKLFNAVTEGLEHEDMIVVLKQGLKKYNLPSGVITMGAKGAVYCDSRTGAEGFVPARKVEVVDSSGAGDAFFSGTVAALIQGVPLEKAVECGTHLSALTIQSTNCNCETETIKNAGIL